MNTAIINSKPARSAGILFLALCIMALFFTLPTSAADPVDVTEVHDYPGATDTRAARSVPAGTANLLDWQQPAYGGAEYVLERIAVEKIALPYTVAFNANGGAPTPPSQAVEHGQTVSQPTDPARTGYAFSGWYQASDFSGSPWDFDHDTVAEDMVLYAKWTPQVTYLVVFVANGGVPAPTMQSVSSGQRVAEPAEITRGGYVFSGWYITWDFSSPPWDFDRDVVTGNTILYARWILNARAQSETGSSLARAEEADAEGSPMEPDSGPEPDATPVSLDQASSPLNAATVWTFGQPDEAASVILEEGHEYRITYSYRSAVPDEPDVYTVTERYQNQSGNAISTTNTAQVASGGQYTGTAPVISGYAFTGATLNGVPQSTATVLIESVSRDFTIVFMYDAADTGGGNRPVPDYAPTGDHPAPPTRLPGADVIFDNDVPLVPAPYTGACRRGGIGVAGAIALLLCSLAAGLSAKEKGE